MTAAQPPTSQAPSDATEPGVTLELLEVVEVSRAQMEIAADLERVVRADESQAFFRTSDVLVAEPASIETDRRLDAISSDTLPRTPHQRGPLPMLERDQSIVITIDGPAGTGKSSVARALARSLGLDFLDTGAMYRAAAAIAIDKGIDPADHDAIVRETVRADLHFDWTADPPRVLAFGQPIDHRLRAADVSELVSPIATIRTLREHMVAKQRLIARQHPRLVTEGRDQGSVVFPDAAVKFYLDAAPEVRARRRAEQLVESGRAADLGRITAEILERDLRDSSRADGPLTCPHDAARVDTSDRSFDEVVRALHEHVLRAVGGMAR